MAAALAAGDSFVDEIPTLFGENFKMLSRALLEGGYVKSVCEAQGGYFLVAETDGRSDVDFVQWLADECGVVCTPMSVFYAAPPEDCTLVRFTICKSRAHIERACAALATRSGPGGTSAERA